MRTEEKHKGKKRIAIFSNEEQSEIVNAFSTGITALIHQPIIRRGNGFDVNDLERFDAVIVENGVGSLKSIPASYSAVGIPVIVFGPGYMDSKEYYQVSATTFNNPPASKSQKDRLAKLKISAPSKTTGSLQQAKPQVAAPKKILVLGDFPSHTTFIDAESWAQSQIDLLKKRHPTATLIYQDTGAGFNLSGFDDQTREVQDISDFDVFSSYEHGSTLVALLAQKEVYNHETSLYHSFSVNYTGEKKTEKFEDFLCRLSYGQFTKEEIASGKPILSILENEFQEAIPEKDEEKE